MRWRRPRLPQFLSWMVAVFLLPGLLAPAGLAFEACDCDGLCRVACTCGPSAASASASCHEPASARSSAALTEEGCGCCVGDATPAPATDALPPVLREAGPKVAIAPAALVTLFLPRAEPLRPARALELHVVSPLAARLRPLLR